MKELLLPKTQNGPHRKRYRKYITTVLMVVLGCLFWWKVVRFPPQIFGTSHDHFRAHVIRPVPASVSNLRTALSDLIIHPDVTYCFRFHISRDDLKKIIAYRSLQKISGNEDPASFTNFAEGLSDACPEWSSDSWWDVQTLSQPEVYQYYDYERRRLAIALWYDVPNNEAYYVFATF